jgi:hypothetical protein
MNLRSQLVILATLIGSGIRPDSAFADYHLERVSPVLNQPTFLTQVPGDPANIIYYTTRITTTLSGFTPIPPNSMGKVWRYDLNTRTSTAVLDLSFRKVYNDDGLQSVAFHPDFNVLSSPGYGKMYVSSAEYIGPTNPPDGNVVPVDRVEEYFLNPTNPAAGAAILRTILQFTNNAQNNHTVGWIGFDPTASGPARNYLYISVADTSYGNNYNGAISPTGRPSQNPADVRGKILRVDISGGDDYPSDPLKNFAIPSANPVPTYNTNHPGTPLMGTNATGAVPALGEVYVTGVRNGYRISFDRSNGDMYWGDVGENTYEEVDFLKAGSNVSGPPVDYGWPQLEATHNSPIVGAPHTTTNPFTGVTSLYPLREYTHSVGQAAIGGYVYHGPITELQNKYFYADFVAGKIWMLDFNRDTDPTTFNGANGALTDVTTNWNSLVVDPANPNYKGDTSLATSNGLDHIVSFGEDNAGNLYLVDFGYGTGFSGQYTANAGELFKLVPGTKLNWTNTPSSLQFWWPGSFKLQAQTNNLASGLGANWFDYPGGATSPITIPINTILDTEFFRLISTP